MMTAPSRAGSFGSFFTKTLQRAAITFFAIITLIAVEILLAVLARIRS